MQEEKKKIGISFLFENKYYTYFAAVFENIFPEMYFWDIDSSEILYFSKDKQLSDCDFFESNHYDGISFIKKVNECPYYPIHTRIFATCENTRIDSKSIESYDDFCNSNYNIALLCADCYVDLYAKDEKILSTIEESCRNKLKCNISPIYEENDPRTAFFI